MTLPSRFYGNHAPTSTGLCVFNVPPSPWQRQAVGPAPATAPRLAGRGGGGARWPSHNPRRCGLCPLCPAAVPAGTLASATARNFQWPTRGGRREAVGPERAVCAVGGCGAPLVPGAAFRLRDPKPTAPASASSQRQGRSPGCLQARETGLACGRQEGIPVCRNWGRAAILSADWAFVLEHKAPFSPSRCQPAPALAHSAPGEASAVKGYFIQVRGFAVH